MNIILSIIKTMLGRMSTRLDAAQSTADSALFDIKNVTNTLNTKMNYYNPVGRGSFNMNGNSLYELGAFSHTEGNGSAATGDYSHAEGLLSFANGESSHAEGYTTKANGVYSHAEGNDTEANGDYSHAEGYNTVANGESSHAEGCYTIANGECQHVEGTHNIEDNDNRYLHIVGNTNVNAWPQIKSNAYTLDWYGNATFAGAVTGAGADYAEYFEWLDGNPDDEDRVGSIVTLEGENIRLANPDDEILGVVSDTAMVLGDNAEWEWRQKYLVDDYGRVITELVEGFDEKIDKVTGERIKVSVGLVPIKKLNPYFDPEVKYVRRSDRPEWETVGLIGKLHVTDDGSCVVGGYAKVGTAGIATASTERTNMKVLKRISDTVILVFMK